MRRCALLLRSASPLSEDGKREDEVSMVSVWVV